MVRRDGVCGSGGSTVGPLYDPETGEAEYLRRCSRHRTETQSAVDAARRQWAANGKPRPEPNAGGVLPRYFNTNWDALWDWADPHRVHYGIQEPTPARPTLRLIQGGES
jgi:hypothetical protein